MAHTMAYFCVLASMLIGRVHANADIARLVAKHGPPFPVHDAGLARTAQEACLTLPSLPGGGECIWTAHSLHGPHHMLPAMAARLVHAGLLPSARLDYGGAL